MHQGLIFGWRQAAICWVFCVAVLSARETMAGGFAERFRRFVLGPDAAGSSQELPTEAPALDEVAAGCMGCHDGTKGPPVRVKGAGNGLHFRGARSINHPVGMVYEEMVLRKPHGFRPGRALGSQVRLVDGKVSCVSCHPLRANGAEEQGGGAGPGASSCTASKRLASGPRGGDLCQACHIK